MLTDNLAEIQTEQYLEESHVRQLFSPHLFTFRNYILISVDTTAHRQTLTSAGETLSLNNRRISQ